MASNKEIQIYDIIGTKGKYHAMAAFTVLWTCAISAAQCFYVQFLAPKVILFWDWDAESLNRTNFDSDNCRMEYINDYNLSSWRSTIKPNLIYESDYSKSTITEKFELVCERSWIISFTKSIPTISIFVGNLLLGHITERFGRRRTSQCLTLLAIVSNVAMLFVPTYTYFAISFFFATATSFYVFLISTVQNTEIVPTSRRPLMGSLIQMGFVLGMFLTPGASWIFKDWFYTQVAQMVFIFCFLPLTWYMIESPTWLMMKGRRDEAKKSVMIIARRNGQFNENTDSKAELWLDTLEEKRRNQKKSDVGRINDLFKNRLVTKYTCLLSIVASCAIFCNNGILLNVESFGSGLYEDYFLSNAVALVSLSTIMLSARRAPVKWIQFLTFLLLAIVCALYPLLCEYNLGRKIITVLGRAIVAPILGVNVAFTAEVYPTSVRIIGQSFVTSVSRLCGVAAPFTKELGEKTEDYMPFVLFSVLSFLSAILYLFLPNTRNKHLTHTIQEMTKIENQDHKQSVYSISTKS